MKKILYVLGGLVGLYLILCLVGASSAKVERSIDINGDTEQIKALLADYTFFYEKWSPWTEKDPSMKNTITGTAGVSGHKMAWDSKKDEVGKGSLTYIRSNADTVMHTLHFDDFGDSQVYQLAQKTEQGTKVTWGMYCETPFFFRPMNLFFNMDKMMGPDYEKGLASLKKAIEEMPKTNATTYQVEELNWDAKTFYGKKDKLSFDKIAPFFAANYPKLFQDLAAAKHQAIGSPKAIYFSFDEKTMVAEVAAVAELANGTELKNWEKFETPAGKTLKIAYYGAYEKSANAHYAMDAYMKQHHLTQVNVIEEYVTDPMTEKDTAKWLTNIFYIVK